ncbi:hypothetical protein LSH36_1587g00069 [Paralvinella palmiformis]|uniref:Uncharacterized protein n=1 Tax=Paralvinella palmiformis TaxID=53620 RepID=A0AAD9MQC2_9ANNE|nr:hypothetical protein LSH36_1587g00069 [Paralvinella palmiformis]
MDQIEHVDGIQHVKEVLIQLKDLKGCPENTLSVSKDIFGSELSSSDATLIKLKQHPKDMEIFKDFMRVCLGAITAVLEKQYKKYFALNISGVLRRETKSAWTHNIDAEEVMGMFSALKNKVPSATICYLSSKMRAVKNRTVKYLDKMPKERRELILKKAINFAQKQRQRKRKKQKNILEEILNRMAEKDQAKDNAARRKVEKKLKEIKPINKNTLLEVFPDLRVTVETLEELLEGKLWAEICAIFGMKTTCRYHIMD